MAAKPPLTLAQKVQSAADAVAQLKAKIKDNTDNDLPKALDVLAQVEAQVLAKAPGWEGVKLSGLIPPGKNPYCAPPQSPLTPKGPAKDVPSPRPPTA